MKPTEENERPDGIPSRPAAALVLARWNSWARLWFPESGTTTWVDLATVGFETVPAPGSVAGDED